MTPDDPVDHDGPTKPLPVDPAPGATEPMVAAHVPVADVSTAPVGPVDPAAPSRSRGLTAGLVTTAALLGVAAIALLTLYLQDDRPTPALTPSPIPSSSPSVTIPPVDTPTTDDPPSEEPVDPAPEPEPTTPPEPTDPPDPEPTETPVVTTP
jgi:hypothetical protein